MRLLCVLVVLLAVGVSRGQPEEAWEVRLTVEALGVGNAGREGDWAGVLVGLADTGSSQREVLVRVESRDVDGDSPQYERTVTTNPGTEGERVWVYAFLPRGLPSGYTVSAYEAEALSGDEADRSGVRFRPGKLVGRTVITGRERSLRSPELGTMLVVGRTPGGLSDYGRRTSNEPWMPRGHEATDVVGGLAPDELPDRAVGLLGIETIVWTHPEPTRVSPARAEALASWIRSGGHLVVALPATPQIWLDTARNPLASLLPRVDFVSVGRPEALLPLLTFTRSATAPESLQVFELTPRADAGPHEADAVLADQLGRTVAARRRVGLGMVTLLGFDPTNRSLLDRGMPEMRALWHRVLGRTGLPPDPAGALMIGSDRTPRYFDSDLGALTSKSQAVVLAVASGFGLFGLYWLVACPGGYWLLRRFGLKRHAWAAFFVSAALFAGISWGLVSVVKPSRVSVRSVTFLDTTDGEPTARVRSFASVLIPTYGQARLRVGSGEDDGLAVIAPWSDTPVGDSSALGGASFPDQRGYPISGRDPSQMQFPTRSTVKTIRADWHGPARWGPIRAVDAEGLAGDIRLLPNGSVTGRIAHALPAPLSDAVVVVVPPQASLSRQAGGSDIVTARVFSLASAAGWEAGEAIDLGVITAAPDGVAAAAQRRAQADYFETLIRTGVQEQDLVGFGAVANPGTVNDRLIAAAFMSRFLPPPADERQERPVALRRHTHGLDLGRWFTQPCVMVVGVMEIAEGDEPAFALSLGEGDGWRELAQEGRVVVRWVYPLAPSPPEPLAGDDESN
jgi:hypothetical protein